MFWSFDERAAELKELGGDLQRLKGAVDFEMFRPLLQSIREKERKDASGRKPFDVVLMFKILVLQTLHNLSDEMTEYQINDRISFMNFLELGLEDTVPDQKTIWLFRDQLRKAGLERKLFDAFEQHLRKCGLGARKGQIVDAAIFEVPRRHEPKESSESDKVPDAPASPAPTVQRKAQSDLDGRWTRKHGRSYFGYKNNIGVDVKHKLVRSYEVTDASAYDGHQLEKLLSANSSRDVYGDSHYGQKSHKQLLEEKCYRENMQQQARRNHPLTARQKKTNTRKARIRARVEHVFARQRQFWTKKVMRVVGLARAKMKIGLLNLVYNFDRYAFLNKA